MNLSNKLPTSLENMKVNLRIKLSALWASVMFCYIYGDYIGLYKLGKLESMIAGQMVPLGPASQHVLLGVSAMMVIPGLMVFLSIALTATVARWTNIIFGALYTIIILATMPGAWVYYIFLGVIEAGLTLLIVWYAWNWPRTNQEKSS